VVIWLGWAPLGALAGEAQVFPLPDTPAPEDPQAEQQRDQDEVSIPLLPGTAEVKPPPAVNPAQEAEDRGLRELPAPTPRRVEASRLPPVGDDVLQRFGRAYRDVEAINGRYARLMPTADPAERQTLAQDGNAEMRAAIERAGLSVSDYNAISLRRWQDEAFAKTLSTVLSANP
jgi:hypothetical protein